MFPTAILFGEIRLLSKSTWAAFLLPPGDQCAQYAIVDQRLYQSQWELARILSPTNEGVIVALLFGIVGVC